MTPSHQVSQVNIPPGVIDLGLGDPQFELLPLELLRRAAEKRFAANDPSFLQYGAEQGDGYFRQALANFLSRGYGFPVSYENLFTTCGVSSGLDLICTLFTRPGDTIFVEEPSYFLALRIFNDHGLRAIAIPTDDDGLVIETLEEKLARHRPKFIYTIPTFQNPTGRTLTGDLRERLVELCQEHGVLILADEVYQFLGYTSQPPKPFAVYTHHEHIISLNSFSKILAPGLRLGWIQSHPAIIKKLVTCGMLDSGGGMNPFTSAIVRGILEDGVLEKNISRLRKVYNTRLKAMDSALSVYLPEAAYVIPQGGFFFWVNLPKKFDTSELQQSALEYKVNFRPGVRFSSQGGLRNALRLSFTFYEVGEIEEGIKRLKRCLESA